MRITYINVKGQVFHLRNSEQCFIKLFAEHDAVPHNMRNMFRAVINQIVRQKSLSIKKNRMVYIRGLGSIKIVYD
jgi:hypothetical protein